MLPFRTYITDKTPEQIEALPVFDINKWITADEKIDIKSEIMAHAVIDQLGVFFLELLKMYRASGTQTIIDVFDGTFTIDNPGGKPELKSSYVLNFCDSEDDVIASIILVMSDDNKLILDIIENPLDHVSNPVNTSTSYQ